MSKIEKAKKFIADPLYPIKDRANSTKELIGQSQTLFLCQENPEAELVLSTIPSGFIHARLDCMVTHDVNGELRLVGVKYIEINRQSRHAIHLYRDFGAIKCRLINENQSSLTKPFNELEEKYHVARLLPWALLVGQWDRID